MTRRHIIGSFFLIDGDFFSVALGNGNEWMAFRFIKLIQIDKIRFNTFIFQFCKQWFCIHQVSTDWVRTIVRYNWC